MTHPTTITLYDTRRKQKAAFQPIDDKQVSIYVCGPTVYNYIHIGNARPAVVFDVLFRLLQRHYDKVKFVRNITDIDDKINAAAQEQGQTIQAFTAQYIQAYRDDLRQLNCQSPSAEPLATTHVEHMLQMIQQLIDKGHAYAAESHVLFKVSSMQDYGGLSKRSQEELLAGARVEVAPYKQDPSDFVLWKPSADKQPGWDSPWGRGRPGWHIECSAMIKAHLGDRIDIHGGGIDLTFPHHENERAQSNCCSEQEFVNFWMHNGYLNMAGEKMSKSLGNFVTLRSLLAEHHGDVLRYALLNAHYRAPLEWSDALLQQAKASLDRFYQVLRDEPLTTAVEPKDIQHLLTPVEQALCDDLNTPLALAALHQLASDYFKATTPAARQQLAAALQAGAAALGLLSVSPANWFQQGSAQAMSADLIEQAIAQRQQAKLNKNYALADKIRADLAQAGVLLEDSSSGTRWHRE